MKNKIEINLELFGEQWTTSWGDGVEHTHNRYDCRQFLKHLTMLATAAARTIVKAYLHKETSSAKLTLDADDDNLG